MTNKEAGWTPFTFIDIYISRITKILVVQRTGFMNCFIGLYHLYHHISPKVLGIANKEAGWTPFTASLIGLHHRITLVSPIKKGVYKLFRTL